MLGRLLSNNLGMLERDVTKLRVYNPAARQEAEGTFSRVFGGARVEDLVIQMEAGFPVEVVAKLRRELNVSHERILRLLHVSRSHLRRNAKETAKDAPGELIRSARLSPAQSARVYRLARALDDAVELFAGDRLAAARWLDAPVRALGGVSPLDYLRNEAASDVVRHLVGRLEHGVIT